MGQNASDEQYAAQVHDIFSQMSADPTKLAPTLVLVAKSDRHALGDAIAEMFATDLRSELVHIRAPVLVVLADGGLQEGMRAQAQGVPDHTVIVVRGTKHFVMIDDPTGFYAAVDVRSSRSTIARLTSPPIRRARAAGCRATPRWSAPGRRSRGRRRRTAPRAARAPPGHERGCRRSRTHAVDRAGGDAGAREHVVEHAIDGDEIVVDPSVEARARDRPATDPSPADVDR